MRERLKDLLPALEQALGTALKLEDGALDLGDEPSQERVRLEQGANDGAVYALHAIGALSPDEPGAGHLAQRLLALHGDAELMDSQRVIYDSPAQMTLLLVRWPDEADSVPAVRAELEAGRLLAAQIRQAMELWRSQARIQEQAA